MMLGRRKTNGGIRIPPFVLASNHPWCWAQIMPSLARRSSSQPMRFLASAKRDASSYFWLSVPSMNLATLSCSAFSDGSCAYTMWPDG